MAQQCLDKKEAEACPAVNDYIREIIENISRRCGEQADYLIMHGLEVAEKRCELVKECIKYWLR